MLCALLLKPGQKLHDHVHRKQGRLARWAERGFNGILKSYEHALDWALDMKPLVMLILVFVVGLNVFLFSAAPKGFFPQQDTGQINGGMRADQSISFQAMQGKLRQLVNIIKSDPAVDTVVGFTGGSRAGGGFMFMNLKPVSERAKGESGQAVIARLRPRLARVTGVQLFLNPVQDLRMGGRQSNSTYQYTLKSDNRADLKSWATKLADAMKAQKALTDVDTDQADNGVETYVDIDKQTASRLGISAKDVDNALYDAFGQRQVANIYDELNQYHVIMGVAQKYARSPAALDDVYVPAKNAATTATGTPAAPANLTAARDPSSGSALAAAPTTMVPLSAIARFAERATPSSVNHQDGELATTISFNLAQGYSLSEAQQAVMQAEADIGMPTNVRGSFQGQAKQAQESNQQQPLLILAAIVVIYIVLGILYESLVHPVTVLSTLPSAGVGAVLALLLFHMEFSIIALIGVFLLIGIVKKNAILIIDFALEAERARGLSATEAVREACLLRFRPILMTTLAAALGALPLAIGFGEGSELRQPLGIAIIGGLIASQLLTLLTTPVVYVYLDKLRRRNADEHHLVRHPLEDQPSTSRT
jgi:multidrug efflux pump